MLASPIEDVLVNACNAIDLLCRKNRTLQDELGKVGIIEQLTELLALDSSNKKNQFLFLFREEKEIFLQKFFVEPWLRLWLR